MKCNKHLTDCSSAVGVCASCLRERLLSIIETQTKYEAQVLLVEPHIEDEHRNSDAKYQHVAFPKSVSPYLSRRKSDNTGVWPHLSHSLSEQRFYRTPEIGTNGMIMTTRSSLRDSRKKKFPSLSNVFRLNTSKFESDSDSNFDIKSKHKKSNSINSMMTEIREKPPLPWFMNLFTSKKKRNAHIVSMSVADEYEYSCGTCPKSTPMQATPQRRKQKQGGNVAGLSFCLSPLVRPSPSRSWNQKGVLPEMVTQSGVAASFKANRSRKLSNFGRFHPSY